MAALVVVLQWTRNPTQPTPKAKQPVGSGNKSPDLLRTDALQSKLTQRIGLPVENETEDAKGAFWESKDDAVFQSAELRLQERIVEISSTPIELLIPKIEILAETLLKWRKWIDTHSKTPLLIGPAIPAGATGRLVNGVAVPLFIGSSPEQIAEPDKRAAYTTAITAHLAEMDRRKAMQIQEDKWDRDFAMFRFRLGSLAEKGRVTLSQRQVFLETAAGKTKAPVYDKRLDKPNGP